jgi:hypothetical protein
MVFLRSLTCSPFVIISYESFFLLVLFWLDGNLCYTILQRKSKTMRIGTSWRIFLEIHKKMLKHHLNQVCQELDVSQAFSCPYS